jgi:cytochrome b561
MRPNPSSPRFPRSPRSPRSVDAGPQAAPPPATWNGGVKFFHWVIALLILVQFALGWLAASWRLSPAKLDLFVWHKSIGVLVLALVLLRLAWRLAAPAAPALPAHMPAWERTAARASHVLLYGLMLALPLSGWVIQSTSGMPFRIFRQWPLPAIAAADKAASDLAAMVHFSLGMALAALLAVHVGAALRHHFVQRDEVLKRMLPAWRRR